MTNREQKIKNLLSGLMSLKRKMTFHVVDTKNMHHITPSQWEVLSSIDNHKESTVKEVATSLDITSSAATQLVDGLVTNGFLVRTASLDDRRSIKINLSKDAKKAIEGIKEQSVRKYVELLEVFDDDEFDQYIALSEKLSKNCLKK